MSSHRQCEDKLWERIAVSNTTDRRSTSQLKSDARIAIGRYWRHRTHDAGITNVCFPVANSFVGGNWRTRRPRPARCPRDRPGWTALPYHWPCAGRDVSRSPGATSSAFRRRPARRPPAPCSCTASRGEPLVGLAGGARTVTPVLGDLARAASRPAKSGRPLTRTACADVRHRAVVVRGSRGPPAARRQVDMPVERVAACVAPFEQFDELTAPCRRGEPGRPTAAAVNASQPLLASSPPVGSGSLAGGGARTPAGPVRPQLVLCGLQAAAWGARRTCKTATRARGRLEQPALDPARDHGCVAFRATGTLGEQAAVDPRRRSCRRSPRRRSRRDRDGNQGRRARWLPLTSVPMISPSAAGEPRARVRGELVPPRAVKAGDDQVANRRTSAEQRQLRVTDTLCR